MIAKIIKVYLDRNTLDILEKDMDIFNIEKNGKSNRSQMANLIFESLKDSMNSEKKIFFEIFNRYLSTGGKKDEKIVYNIFENLKFDKLQSLLIKKEIEKLNEIVIEKYFEEKAKKIDLNDFFYFRLTNGNSGVLKSIIEQRKNEQKEEFSPTLFFRALFLQYVNNPQYQREKILFHANYSLIKKAIASKSILHLEIHGKDNLVSCRPLAITSNKDEQFNYFISSSNEQIRSIRLSNIKKVHISNENFSLNLEEIQLINELDEKNFDPFTLNKDNIKIKLTSQGEKLYKRLVHNRPTISHSKDEAGIYELETSKDKVFSYFFKFGKEVSILEPSDLRERFKNELIEALKNYE